MAAEQVQLIGKTAEQSSSSEIGFVLRVQLPFCHIHILASTLG